MPAIADLLKRVNRLEIAIAIWIGTMVAADQFGAMRAHTGDAGKLAAAIAREQLEKSDLVKERIENDARRDIELELARNRAGGPGVK